MPGPLDVQITIAQQVTTAYQQQLHQQQPIVHQQHTGQTILQGAREEETQVQSVEKGGQEIRVEEKRGRERFFKKKRREGEEEEEEREEIAVPDEIRGKIIDVIG